MHNRKKLAMKINDVKDDIMTIKSELFAIPF